MIYADEGDTYHDGGNHQGLVLETLDNLGVSFTKVPAHIHTASLSPSADLAMCKVRSLGETSCSYFG